ncbi:hypothetical protein V497_01363 [Pseudogymnoascus sp. VKM F-4516 (FW-969)]|nr:hypothetical protein V497_01363 [Pseudogymnoascus sp. VKM F-4516 (FW-969)]
MNPSQPPGAGNGAYQGPGPTAQNYTDYIASLGRLEQANRTRFQNAGIPLPAGPYNNPRPSYVLGGDGSAFPVPRNNPSIPASAPFGSSTGIAATTPANAVNRPVDSGRPLPGFYEAFSGVAPSLAGQTSSQFNGAPQPGQHRPGYGPFVQIAPQPGPSQFMQGGLNNCQPGGSNWPNGRGW